MTHNRHRLTNAMNGISNRNGRQESCGWVRRSRQVRRNSPGSGRTQTFGCDFCGLTPSPDGLAHVRGPTSGFPFRAASFSADERNQ